MNNIELEIRRLEKELIEAILRRDSAYLNRILADDLTTITPFGDLLGKQVMANIDANDDLVNQSIVTDEIEVRVYGDDAAVVTGRATVVSRFKDRDLSGQYRYTRVYVRQQENWQIVAYQATRIAGQEAASD